MRSKKVKSVAFNNRKKQLTVHYSSGKKIVVHYGQIGIKANIESAWVDKETGGKSIGFEFSNGKTDYMPYDQPLAVAQDPEFLLQTHIELLVAKINDELKKQRISKRYLAIKLETSDNQVQRLLNPHILNKNLEQLYKIAAILGLEFEFRIKAA